MEERRRRARGEREDGAVAAAPRAPATAPAAAEHVLALQASAGNHAVGRMLARRISTPLPRGARPQRNGDVRLTINGVTVVLHPDVMGGTATETSFEARVVRRPGYRSTEGRVTSVTTPVVEVHITTTYAEGADPASQSQYGRGTTPEDQRAGNTSLGFHEGQHGVDLMNWVRDHPMPAFTGRRGQEESEFETAMQEWSDALTAWAEAAEAESEQHTDEVGTTRSSVTGSGHGSP